MDKVEGHCLNTDRLGQLDMGKQNHDPLLSAALIYYSERPVMKFHIRGDRRRRSFKAVFLQNFLEILQHIVCWSYKITVPHYY